MNSHVCQSLFHIDRRSKQAIANKEKGKTENTNDHKISFFVYFLSSHLIFCSHLFFSFGSAIKSKLISWKVGEFETIFFLAHYIGCLNLDKAKKEWKKKFPFYLFYINE